MIKFGVEATRMMKRNEARNADKELRKQETEKESYKKKDRNILNRKSSFNNKEEEIQDRYETAEETLKAYTKYLPGILKDLSGLKDPRNPKKVTHKLALLMLYGIFIFVFHLSSRRDANSKITPIFLENMRQFFPELENIPHSCTLARVLESIESTNIERSIVKLVSRLIRDKKLINYMVSNKYVFAIDGSQKFTRDWDWSKNSLTRHIKGRSEDEKHYYAYALEASLVLPSGLTIPVLTEFLERNAHKEVGVDNEKNKMDCEYKAFMRLTARLKKYFPQLKIVVTLDGLYPKGPIFEQCQKFGWDYMIVLKDGSLKSVWDDIEKLKEKDKVERHSVPEINGVKQDFWYVNGIEYHYGDNGCKSIIINVVVCEETITDIDEKTGKETKKAKKFAWISFKEINSRNVEKRCNQMGRPRWNIETQNLVEKHHGYSYEHCFSYDWNAMQGFHYLMHLAHIINNLTLFSTKLKIKIKLHGVRRTIELIFLVFKAIPLDFEKLKFITTQKYYLKLDI